jgi:hypothetical protein
MSPASLSAAGRKSAGRPQGPQAQLENLERDPAVEIDPLKLNVRRVALRPPRIGQVLLRRVRDGARLQAEGERARSDDDRFRRAEELAALVEHALFDHLICPQEKRLRDRQPECLCRLEVDHESEAGGLLYRKIPRPDALEDSSDQRTGSPPQVAIVRPVDHETTGLGKLALPEDRRQLTLQCEPGDPSRMGADEDCWEQDDALGACPSRSLECRVEFLKTRQLQELQTDSQRACRDLHLLSVKSDRSPARP